MAKRTHGTSVPKTEEPMHSGSERGQLGRDCQKHRGKPRRRKSSRRGRQPEQSSGEDKEMCSWDELEYKANYVCFISNESTERQVRIASPVVDKLEEPVYDHRTRIK